MDLYIYNHFDPTTKDFTNGPVSNPVQWSDDPIANFTKVETFIEVHCYGFNRGFDYKSVRDVLKSIVTDLGQGDVEAGFDSLSDEEKVIASGHKIGSRAQGITALGYEPFLLAMDEYQKLTDESRLGRARHARTLIHTELPDQQAAILGVAGGAFNLYITYGVDGIEYGDVVPGLSDYLDSINGYENIGFSDSVYNPITMTQAELQTRLEDSLFKGKFE